MKSFVILSLGASALGLAACTSMQSSGMDQSAMQTPSPDLSEQQALVGARAGDNLPNGSETYVDGERVGSADDKLEGATPNEQSTSPSDGDPQ